MLTSLLSCIQNETTAMAELTQVLQEEQTLLTQAPTLQITQEIAAVTRRKNQYIAEVANRSQLRQKFLNDNGISETDSRAPAWLQDTETQLKWDALLLQTEKAKELNRVNGALIAKHIARNQSTLQVLYQHNTSSSNNAGLYGPSGHATDNRARRAGFAAK